MLQLSGACRLLLCVYFEYLLSLFFSLFWVLAWHNLTPACLTIKESKIKLKKKKRITGCGNPAESETLADFTRFHTSISVRLQGKKMRQLNLLCCRASLCRVASRFPFRLCQLHVAHTQQRPGGERRRRGTKANDWRRPGNCTSGTYANRSGPVWDVVGDLPASILSDKLSAAILSGRTKAAHRTRA